MVDLGNDMCAVESTERFGLRIVNVTVPDDTAGPLASQICWVPLLWVVS